MVDRPDWVHLNEGTDPPGGLDSDGTENWNMPVMDGTAWQSREKREERWPWNRKHGPIMNATRTRKER